MNGSNRDAMNVSYVVANPRRITFCCLRSLHVFPRGLCKYPYFKGFHHIAMIFLPDFLYNSFLFPIFTLKYRRYVVKTALAPGA